MRKRQIVRFRLRFESWAGLIGQHDTGWSARGGPPPHLNRQLVTDVYANAAAHSLRDPFPRTKRKPPSANEDGRFRKDRSSSDGRCRDAEGVSPNSVR